MSIEESTTQPAMPAAPPADEDKPSWHGPVKALQEADAKHDARLSNLESGFARLEQKTDAQTVILGEIKGALFAGGKLLSENPWVRRFVYAIAVALAGLVINWLRTHGVIVEFTP